MPLLIGTNSNDFIGFVSADSTDALFAQFGANAARARARAAYDPDGTATLQRVLMMVGIDRAQAEPAQFTANAFARTGVPTYLYRFSYVPTALRGLWVDGVPHGAESPSSSTRSPLVARSRPRVLRTGDRRFVFLLAEQVLYSQVPSANAMVEQLDRLVAAMALTRVSLGIIPATGGMGAHTQTSFWIFDDSLVQVETLTSGLDITRPEELELYLKTFERMRGVAVFGRNAKALIARARHDFEQQSLVD